MNSMSVDDGTDVILSDYVFFMSQKGAYSYLDKHGIFDPVLREAVEGSWWQRVPSAYNWDLGKTFFYLFNLDMKSMTVWRISKTLPFPGGIRKALASCAEVGMAEYFSKCATNEFLNEMMFKYVGLEPPVGSLERYVAQDEAMHCLADMGSFDGSFTQPLSGPISEKEMDSESDETDCPDDLED
jgi:hypothetical protein